MSLGFKKGDTVDVLDGDRVIRGDVTRIEYQTVDEVEAPVIVEVKRPGGSSIEFLPVDGSFDHVTKVV